MVRIGTPVKAPARGWLANDPNREVPTTPASQRRAPPSSVVALVEQASLLEPSLRQPAKRSPSPKRPSLPPPLPAGTADAARTCAILGALHALRSEIDPITREDFSDVIEQRHAKNLPGIIVLIETHLECGKIVFRPLLADQMPNAIEDLTHDPVNRQPMKSLHIGLALPGGEWLTFEHIDPALAQLFGDAARCANSKPIWKPAVTEAKLFLAAVMSMRDCLASAKSLVESLQPQSRNQQRRINRAAFNLLTTPQFLDGSFDQHRHGALTEALLSLVPSLALNRKAALLDTYASFASFEVFKALLRYPGFEVNTLRTERVEGELRYFTPLYRLLHGGAEAVDASDKIKLLKRHGAQSFCLLYDD